MNFQPPEVVSRYRDQLLMHSLTISSFAMIIIPYTAKHDYPPPPLPPPPVNTKHVYIICTMLAQQMFCVCWVYSFLSFLFTIETIKFEAKTQH